MITVCYTMRIMNTEYTIPTDYKDFTSDYIAQLAKERNFLYADKILSSETDTESSLFNNLKTDTIEAHKLTMDIEGLICEYYTGLYTPVTYAGNTILKTTSGEKEARTAFQVQVFCVTLPYDVESLYVESRTNSTLNNLLNLSSVYFKDSKRVQLEGDFNAFFRVYTPKNEELTAFTILAPNIMLQLLEDGGNYDFEFSRNKIYFYKTFAYSTPAKIVLNKADYDGLLAFGIKSAARMARAARPAQRSVNSNQQYMWQLFGLRPLPLLFTTLLIFSSFIFIALCVVMPLLWPVLIVIGVFIFIRYQNLISKKKRLNREWARKQETAL